MKIPLSFRSLGLKLYSNPILKNIRIYYLILTIIAVMLIFIMVQGYLSITSIDTMQRTNQEIFNTSMRFSKEISVLKENLLFVKENYLKRLSALSDASALNYTFRAIDNNLQTIAALGKDTPNFDDERMKIVIVAVEKVKKLAYAPDTKENFTEFETELAAIIQNLGVIQTGAQNSLYRISSNSALNARNQKNTVITFLVISALIAVLTGLFTNASISRPLREIIKSARSMAAGDFTQDIRTFGCKEAYEVVQELNISLSSLRLLIGDINKESERVAAASAELKNAAKNSGQSAEEVARAMEELARAASNQADQLSKTVQTVNILGEKVRKVSRDTLKISGTSRQVAKSAQNGQEVTSNVAEEINQIYNSTKAMVEVIRELNETTLEIGEITTEIREIADQTTLLTLNASIEAARAGEHGKGFSVVASETGKLAERCRSAAQTISGHIAEIIQKTGHTAELMEQSMARVEAGKNLAGQARVTFEAIFNELKVVVAEIAEVAASAEEMNEHTEEVVVTVSNIAAISEESMASTEEVSATAEEQTAVAEEVTAYAENLLTISNEMKQTAAVFKI
ncbi:MAG: methyl-accepting chemotaxis protein [Bacillota bacterium]